MAGDGDGGWRRRLATTPTMVADGRRWWAAADDSDCWWATTDDGGQHWQGPETEAGKKSLGSRYHIEYRESMD